MSNYEDESSQIKIPSYTFHKQRNFYELEVFNESTETFFMLKGKNLGYVVQHGQHSNAQVDQSEFDIVQGSHLKELLEAEELQIEEQEHTICDVKVDKGDPVVPKIFDRDKLDDEDLKKFHKQGVKMTFEK